MSRFGFLRFRSVRFGVVVRTFFRYGLCLANGPIDSAGPDQIRINRVLCPRAQHWLKINAQRSQIRLRQIMDGKLEAKFLPAQAFSPSGPPSEVEGSRSRTHRQRNGIESLASARKLSGRVAASTPLRSARNDNATLRFSSPLDQLHLVAFRCVDKGDSTAVS